jgi:hypothetical protein
VGRALTLPLGLTRVPEGRTPGAPVGRAWGCVIRYVIPCVILCVIREIEPLQLVPPGVQLPRWILVVQQDRDASLYDHLLRTSAPLKQIIEEQGLD